MKEGGRKENRKCTEREFNEETSAEAESKRVVKERWRL